MIGNLSTSWFRPYSR